MIWRPATSFGLSNASEATFGEKNIRIFSNHKALEIIGKVRNHDARVQRWLEFLTAFDYTLEYRKGSTNGNADFLSRLPRPATEHDRSGSTRLNPVEDGGIYLIRACGSALPPRRSRVSAFGGLVLKVLTWVGSLSPPPSFAIFAHTGHV